MSRTTAAPAQQAANRLNFINGEFVAAASGKTFENRSPVDARLLGLVSEAGAPEVDAAVKAARAALAGPWGSLEMAERTELLYAVANEINRRFDEFLEAEVADTGKPASLAKHIDIPRGAANFKIFADVVKNVPSEFFQMATPDKKGAINYAIRVPKGVIAVIAPWNLPLLLMTWKVGPALACGNTVVVKPSEETPSTATLLGEVMNAVGVPKGVYNVIHGFGPGSAGELLTRHSGIDAVTFTGETRTGAAIMKAVADRVRPVSFELGGKNAGIVFADCDFDAAIEGMGRAVFANCGQVCLGTERVYVERPIFDKFVAALKAKAESLKPGRAGGRRHRPGAADQPGASRQGAVLLRARAQGGRDRGHRRRHPENGRRTCEGLLGRADHLDRAAGGFRRGARGDLRALLPRARRSTPRRRRCASPTTRSTASRPPSGPRISRARTASPRKSKSASAGSTAGSCATCARPSAARNSPASAARAACIRSSSTPSCATSA